MEVSKYINVLKKNKWVLIGVPFIVLLVTLVFVCSLPESYPAHVRMSTGLVDRSQQVLANDGFQEGKVNSEFSNLIEMMRLEKVYDQLSYKLILHDLIDSVPFRKPSGLMLDLNKSAKAHAIEVYQTHYTNRTPLSSYDSDEDGLRRLIISMGYDKITLDKKVKVVRPNNSDFIDINFESPNAYLSAFVVNTLSQEFIAYYTEFIRNNQIRTVNFLDTVLIQKESEMNRLKSLLKGYKIENRVLNLAEQAKSLYNQLADFETKKQMAEKDVVALNGAIQGINDKFNPSEQKYIENSMVPINLQIAATKDYIMQLSDEYIKSNYSNQVKIKLDSARKAVATQIQQSVDKYLVNPLTAKESLVMQKIQLEMNRDIAKYSIVSLSDELVSLNNKFDLLVPHEAVIQNYEGAIDVATKEYLEAQSRFNRSSMESNLSISLRQIEKGVPGLAVPSNKLLIVILSFLTSIVLCLIGLFIVFYIDDAIVSAKDLSEHTEVPVLGYIPLLTSSVIKLNQLWEKPFDENLQLQTYKEMLRSARYEIESEMGKAKVLLVNSLCNTEGKSFFTLSLAFAFLMVRKRVLLIDGNFANPTITESTGTELNLESYLSGETSLPSYRPITQIMVFGNNGGDTSLFEISDPENIQSKINALKNDFDIIIIDAPGLSQKNKSKEWMAYAEKVVTIFESGKKISYKKNQNVLYLKGLETKFIGWILNKDENEKLVKPKKQAKKSALSTNIELQWA